MYQQMLVDKVMNIIFQLALRYGKPFWYNIRKMITERKIFQLERLLQ